jgi:hemolysin III
MAVVVPQKPLLRGWFHAGAAVVSALFTVALCWHTWSDTSRMIACAIFGLSMVQLYSVSALYHIGSWRQKVRHRLNALDHADIFMQIAGTYTPICMIVLSGWLRATLLGAVWLLAAVGVPISVLTRKAPAWVMPVICIAMGWAGMVALPSLVHALPVPAIICLITGGLLYTLGGIVFALRRPDPFPNVLGFHEVFHVLVIAAGTAFAVLVWFWVVPLPGT